MKNKSALVIFDMDGVLVDVSCSYREVVRLTVVTYLRAVLGADALPGDFITLTDVDEIKKSGSLNNDWDLTCAIVDLLLRRYFDGPNGNLAGPGTGVVEARNVLHDGEKLARIRALQKSFDTRTLIAGVRVKPIRALYAEDLKERGGSEVPPAGCVDREVPHAGVSRTGGEKSPFLFNEGDVGTGNLMKRIFQELYLGPALFEEVYGMRTIVDQVTAHRAQAFIDRERLIPSTAHLVELESLGGLAVATGRPRVEALYPLRKYGIAHLFKAVVSEDDVVEAEAAQGRSLRKPDPFSVVLAMERCGAVRAGVFTPEGTKTPDGSVFYVGDMPGDMTAALGAGARPVGFVDEWKSTGFENAAEERTRHRELLFRAGAGVVFGSYDELVSYVKNPV